MISSSERPKFFALQHRAWLTHAARTGADPHDRGAEEKWRYQETFSVLSVESITQIDPVDGFDRIMLHWAQILGDDREITYWITAPERRMKRRLRIAMQQLAQLESLVITWDYVRGILDRMKLPTDIDECPADLLRKAYQALDTHIRRRIKAKKQEAPLELVPF